MVGAYTTRVVAPTPDDWEGSWHHLAGVYDGKELRLFVDGRMVGQTAHSGAIEDTPFPVNVGRDGAPHGQEHPGQAKGTRQTAPSSTTFLLLAAEEDVE